MTKEEIVQRFILAGKLPTKYNIQEVLGISAQTLVRRGLSMGEIKRLYKCLTVVEKRCLVCESLLSNQQRKYCSHSCSAKATNSIRSEIKQSTQIYEKRCLYCETVLSKIQKKYCGLDCQHSHHRDLFINDWLSGRNVQSSKGSGGVSNRIRKYLFEKFSCKCSNCGWGEINQSTGKAPLEVEHIDGNSDNNSPDNLTLLCPNCHSLTSTYKSLNRGNGRHARRQRYSDGKSY